ncbi:ABC transporter ATP-binding protein [Aciduricibacillus chroicocephali]|uniref:ABC transporter ATP-binding protein n=1 Tax=Aciduricibacillus chroicocephali TaxID=3054939 RepID=A0ABY9KSG1_9BACI|nr:ABC transporter ATP-binding protein [Bacillaceae bacterium 44XB]
MTFLSIDNISHLFFNKDSTTEALDSISFTMNEGEFISLLGPSGCGKSTLLNIIAGLINQTEGEVLLQGKRLRDQEHKIGYMLQQDYLFPWKTILDNVMLGPQIAKVRNEEIELEAMNLLEEVGLTGVEDKYPNSLSGGMRQRAALVRTLINEPEILLLDEPFSALDYFTKLKLEDLVSKILKTYQKTAILVTHDIGEAISMSDRIIVLDRQPGKIHQIFEVPIELRNERPFLCRRHSKYQTIFEKVWGAMNVIEAGTATIESGGRHETE